VTPKRPALLPVELWEQLSEPLQVVISAMVEYYEQRIAELEADVRELTTRLNQNSQNSSKPPSSDGPHVKRKPPNPPSGRKPGGQSGHPPHQRALVPGEHQQPGGVDDTTNLPASTHLTVFQSSGVSLSPDLLMLSAGRRACAWPSAGSG